VFPLLLSKHSLQNWVNISNCEKHTLDDAAKGTLQLKKEHIIIENYKLFL